MYKKKTVCLIIGLFILFTGCGRGTGYFGEETYLEQEAGTAYEKVTGQIEDFYAADCAYSVEIRTDEAEISYYRTEKYTAAYAADDGAEEYLWYQGTLYADKDGAVFYAKQPWEKLEAEQWLKRAEEMSGQLMDQKPAQLSYKRVPMAGENACLLTVKYSIATGQGEQELYPTLRIWLDENTDITQLIVELNGPVSVGEDGIGRGGSLVTISIYPYKDSVDYQAERKIWRFAHEHGLLEQGVPALETQKEDRKNCEQLVQSICFEELESSGAQDDSMKFPEVEG